MGKSPIEVDFGNFWRTTDETYFCHVAPENVEAKWKELAERVPAFTQNHHHGTLPRSS